MKQMKWAEKTALSVLERTPKLYEKGYNGKWSYDYGVVLRGFALLWKRTGSASIFSISGIIWIILSAKTEACGDTARMNTISIT